MGIALAVGVQETRTISRIKSDSARWLELERTGRAARTAARVTELQQILTEAALAAVERAESDTTRLPSLALPAAGRTETGLALFLDGRLEAHVGQSRVPLDTGGAGLSLVRTAFYTAMISRQRSANGRLQATAVALLSSLPPADRFTRTLIQDVAGPREGSVTILPPNEGDVAPDSSEQLVRWGANAFARVVAAPRLLGEALASEQEGARVRTGIPLAIASVLLLVIGWRRPARTRERLAMLVAMLAIVALLPLGLLSNKSGVFDPSNYHTPMGGRLTANVAALIITASLSLSGLFLLLRSPRLWVSRRLALVVVLVLASAGPFMLRDLARGIVLSPTGASTKLWLAWQLAIALAGASVLVAGASAGQIAIGTRRGLPWWLAPIVAGVAAVLALPFWNSTGAWPTWYPALWILAIALLAFVRRSPRLIVGAALVAGCGAVTLTWGQTVRARMNLAAADVSRLDVPDNDAVQLLERFARTLQVDSAQGHTEDDFVRKFAASLLANAGYSARIALWANGADERPRIDVRLASVRDTVNFQRDVARMVRGNRNVQILLVPTGAIAIHIAAIPLANGDVITVSVPPLNLSTSGDPFETLTGLGIRARDEPPYKLILGAFGRDPSDRTSSTLRSQLLQPDLANWRRSGTMMHGDGVSGAVPQPVHVEIDMRGAAALVPRGALLVLFDVAAVLVLWALSAMSDGGLWRWLRQRMRQWSRSYRIRLSLALLAFFAVPATAFTGWAAYRLREDNRAARELVVREALRVAALEPTQAVLAEISNDVGASLYLYRDAQLVTASDRLLDELAPLGRLLPRNLFEGPESADPEDFTAMTVANGETTALVGYRSVRISRDTAGAFALPPNATRPNAVVATPARGNDFELDERRTDLAVQVLFALALGALAALWLSGVAARSLARPVGTLREAALALAGGQRALHLDDAPAEFVPVFSAFGQMAGDLSASRDALEAAQRRTEAVLQHVASGVLAVNPSGAVIIANPRAETMLHTALRPGLALQALTAQSDVAPLFARVLAFLDSAAEDGSFEETVRSRQLTARLTRLPAGAVLTLDDVTDIALAQRVLAWGEMARQVAHEIKNPLTPIRLGVQHLRRAYRDKRGDFSEILEKNVGRVLEEIDRLDEIARAFSRYGTAPAEREPPHPVSLSNTVQTVLALESLGDSGVNWRFHCSVSEPSDVAWARADELKEVLLNLLENARLAEAKSVDVLLDADGDTLSIAVVDDGSGIARDVLPRIFEPHFSTRTSGSGLGLAISRRLIESWGGTVEVRSVLGAGTTMRIVLRAAS